MKTIITSIGIMSILISCQKQSADLNEVEEAVRFYTNAADHQNTDELNIILHSEYRALANRVFDSETLQVLSKEKYMNLIKDGIIGGDKREVSIQHSEVIENNAVVRASLHGKDHIFETVILLAKDVSGQWAIVSDMPQLTKLYE